MKVVRDCRELPKTREQESNAPWTACDLSPPSLKRVAGFATLRAAFGWRSRLARLSRRASLASTVPLPRLLCVTSPAGHGGTKFPHSTASPEFRGVPFSRHRAARWGAARANTHAARKAGRCSRWRRGSVCLAPSNVVNRCHANRRSYLFRRMRNKAGRMPTLPATYRSAV